jgi:selenoprotein W-related protein
LRSPRHGGRTSGNPAGPSAGIVSELSMTQSKPTHPKPGPRIAITYCSMCNWLLRSAWMAQELLQTFGQDLGEVVLIPRTGGIFQIHYDGDLIWDRSVDGGFPDVKQLKQRVRDRLDPERDLGHLDDHKKKLVQG